MWATLPPSVGRTSKAWVYGIDGKWLHRERVFLVHRDVTNRENLWWSSWQTESYVGIKTDLTQLSEYLSGHFPVAVISDWKKTIRIAITECFGDIPHQRCLAHVARLALVFLPKKSPFLATQRLRDIALGLRKVRTQKDQNYWEQTLTNWGYQYGDMLSEKTKGLPGGKKKWWYTHGKLRQGWRLLTTETAAFFLFLAVKGLPKTNNSLEGVNRNLKGKLGIHRGLTVDYQVSFLSWVMIFSRAKKKADVQRLWVTWNKHQ